MTSKGQITIPAEIRKGLDLHPGDELVFELQGNEARVRAVRSRTLTQLRGALDASREFSGRDAARLETARGLGEAALASLETEKPRS